MNRRGPVARVTRGSISPALPRRASHGDVTVCRRELDRPSANRTKAPEGAACPRAVFFLPLLSFSSLPLSSGAASRPPPRLPPPPLLSFCRPRSAQPAGGCRRRKLARFPAPMKNEADESARENGSDHGRFCTVAAVQGRSNCCIFKAFAWKI